MSGTGARTDNSIPKAREQEGNEEKTFPKFRNGKGMQNTIPVIQERELEAFILGIGREREDKQEEQH